MNCTTAELFLFRAVKLDLGFPEPQSLFSSPAPLLFSSRLAIISPLSRCLHIPLIPAPSISQSARAVDKRRAVLASVICSPFCLTNDLL